MKSKKIKPNKKPTKAAIPFDTSVMVRNNKIITYTRALNKKRENLPHKWKIQKIIWWRHPRYYLTSQTARIGSLKQIRAIKSLPMIDVEPPRWMDEPQRNIGKLESISKSVLSWFRMAVLIAFMMLWYKKYKLCYWSLFLFFSKHIWRAWEDLKFSLMNLKCFYLGLFPFKLHRLFSFDTGLLEAIITIYFRNNMENTH